jgi:hypothetical protein
MCVKLEYNAVNERKNVTVNLQMCLSLQIKMHDETFFLNQQTE